MGELDFSKRYLHFFLISSAIPLEWMLWKNHNDLYDVCEDTECSCAFIRREETLCLNTQSVNGNLDLPPELGAEH